MKRKCMEHSECAVARALDAIGDWWSLLILREAFGGKRRFSEFQKSLGVARNILAVRLKKLVALDIFEQAPASDGSAFHEYVLTEKGRGLYVVLMALRQWGESSLECPEATRHVVIERATGRQVQPISLRSEDGRLLGPDDVVIVDAKEAANQSSK